MIVISGFNCKRICSWVQNSPVPHPTFRSELPWFYTEAVFFVFGVVC